MAKPGTSSGKSRNRKISNNYHWPKAITNNLRRMFSWFVLVSLTVQCIAAHTKRGSLWADAQQPPATEENNNKHLREATFRVEAIPSSSEPRTISRSPVDSGAPAVARPAAGGGRGGGQPEAFSTEWTGLGDLEATDAFKKMNRRRRHSYERFAINLLSKNERRTTSKRAKLYALHQVDQLEPEPILVSRRTEDLLEPPGQQQQQVTGNESPDEQEEHFPLLGEFGSKISLLTTRKTEPHALLGIYKTQLPASLNSQRWAIEDEDPDSIPIWSRISVDSPQMRSLMVKKMLDDALVASAKAGTLEFGQEPETVSIMERLSSNYLPRIARKVIRRRR